MITASSLEVSNRMRGERPIVVVVTRRRVPASDDAVRFVTQAAKAEDVDAVALDVDDAGNAAFLDEVHVKVVPEIFVAQRGIVLERGSVASAEDARALFVEALRRVRR